MRELKFRIWDSISQIYYDESDEPVLEFMHEQDGIVLDYNNYSDERVYTIEQFTGLVDRHGVEIYEGDMLKAKHDDGQYDTGEVVYGSKGAFCLYLPCVASGIKTPLLNYIHGMMFPEYDFEVIGNIHENGELLE